MNGHALARLTDPGTSHEAASSVKGEISARLQRMLLDLLNFRCDRGITSSEASAMLNIPRDSLSPRWKSLVRANLVHDSGEKRPGPSGRRQIVWKLGVAPLPKDY